MMRNLSPLLAMVLVTLGCGPSAPTLVAFPILIEARSSDDESVLAGVTVERTRGAGNSEALGATGADGTLAHTFRLPAGTQIQLATHCPEGFQLATPLTPMVVFPLVQGAATHVRTRVACAPEKRSLVVVVRAIIEHGLERLEPAPGLPIAVDGIERTQTSTIGIAHVLLEGTPRSSFRLRLSTANAALRPENPERLFVIPETSDYVVFEQRFEPRTATSSSTPRRGSRRHTTVVRRSIPVRIP